MTEKEKVNELIKKFYPQVQWKLGQEDCLDRAKKCVLILVDEMLNNFLSNRTTEYGRERYKFWQEVKQEIEKL